MADLAADMASLVDVIIRPLVEYKDDIDIASSLEGSTVYVDVRVNAEDAGKVIGRQGRVIKAIRTLARAAAAREGVDVEVELLD